MAVDLSVFDRLKTKADYDRAEEEFQLRKLEALKSKQNALPAALQIADAYAQARAAGDTQRMNDIAIAAKSFDKGVVYDQMGNPIAMGGYGDAVGSIAGTKKAYEANAQNASDLQYDPLTAGREAEERLTQQLAIEPSINAANKQATMQTEAQTNAQLNLPKAESQAKQVQKILTDIETSPGLSASVGMPDIRKGRIPWIGDVAGSPAADFTAKLEQLKGTQFLTAFEQLKGGGAITEVEGTKAENAIARMQTSQSEKEFLKALNEFKVIVAGAVDRQRALAGQPTKLNPSKIPMTAVRDLRSDSSPEAQAEFDEVFGQGAARMVLGGK